MSAAVTKPTKNSKMKKLEEQRAQSRLVKEPKHLARDEFDLEEIAYVLSESMQENKIYTYIIYKHDELLEGTVVKMDANTKLIHIKDRYMGIHKIHFLDILKVSDVE
ncbi:YolD-like family protein [Lysinibacillus sp. NPDC097195]|uniref:YolD-like family protein n=1 Tax=Lysinibacillus sp. NPDC097195 TaxID=3364141 RepID=UPI0037FD2F78